MLLTALGAFVPSHALVGYLRAAPEEIPDHLLLGATLFRAGLAVLGVVAIALASLPIWEPGAGKEAPPSDSHSRAGPGVLAVLLLSALALRLYALDSGLWLDEIYTLVLFARAPFGSIVTTFESENQHFLYSLLAHASLQLFGESAWALRLPAALFGVGGVWALYLLGREVAGAREGLLAAALLAFSYTHVWFSQNARGYSGLLFATVLASYLFLRARREAHPRLWVAYAAVSALGTYVHVTMLFVLAGHFLLYAWTLFARRKAPFPNRWAGFFLGFALAGLLVYQLYALVLPQVVGSMGREQSVVEAWKSPLWTLLEVVRGMQVSFAGSLVAVAALAVFGAGLVSYARTSPALVHLLVVPAALGAAVVVGLGHHLWPRFFFFAMGFGVLVVIRGALVAGQLLGRAARLPAARAAWVGAALCLGLILVSAASIPRAYGPKQDYVGAADFVEANREPGDAVVVAGLAAFPYRSLYQKDWEYVETLPALDAARAHAKRTWLVYTFPPVLEAVQPQIMASVEREFRVVRQFEGTVGGGAVFVTRSAAPTAGLVDR